MFKPVSNRPDFAKNEEAVLKLWESEGTFAKSLEQRRGAPAGKQRDHLARRLSGTVLRVHTLKRSLHQLPWRVNAIHGLFIM